MQTPLHRNKGFSLVEIIVAIAVFILVFGGIFGIVQMTLKMISSSKSTTSALALANERMEYIRSLSYNSVGTVGGIPDGPIPQNSTTTLNGIIFHERVLIEYIDSPDDGEGGADTNGILADYKQVKVEYSWQGIQGTSTIFLLSNMVPPGIETTAGGGTLIVNVFDALVQPISGASVHIYNDTTTTTIDTTRSTNASGVATFAGAPAAANYQITVTKAGFSTDQTYIATSSNPVPVTLPVAVIESAVSTMNFQIDELSDLAIHTSEPPSFGQFTDTFDDMTLVASSSGIVLNSGDVELSGGAGSYVSSGMVYSTSTTPTTIVRWDSASFTSITPSLTTLAVHVYDVTGPDTFSLISDTDLPGNSTGFSTGSIDLSTLSVGSHPTLALSAVLTSSDVNVTPLLREWNLSYVTSEPSIASIPLTITGSKIIGTYVDTTPIYKYSESLSTNGSGVLTLTDLEWDQYTVDLNTGAYDISEACNDIPYVLNPGVSETLNLTLVPDAVRSMRVSVTDDSNTPIKDATVDISRTGISDSGVTSSCGQVFFNTGLSSSSDYQIDVAKAGYTSKTITDISITGDEVLKVVLIPS